MNSMKFLLFSLTFASCLLKTQAFAEESTKGAELYKQCISCHGDKGDGIPAQKAPRLAGQHDWYILKQLQDIKAGQIRKNQIMIPFVNKLSEQDMKDLAAYISKL